MEKTEEKKKLYFSMVIGSIGMILIGVGILQFLFLTDYAPHYFLITVGFALMIDYIYRLERGAGIPNKVIWIRAALLILLMLGLIYNFFK